MFRSRFTVLILALLLGIGAAGAAVYYMSKVTEAANPVERVVVAKTTIPARTKVTEDMLTVRSVPSGARHSDAVSSMQTVVGKSTKQTIAAGEQVLTSKFFNDRAQSGLAFVIPEGKRAVAVKVNEHIGAGGLIAAGDHVDIIGYCNINERNGNAASVEVTKAMFALQNIEVLSVAQKIVGDEAPQVTDVLKGAGNSLSTQRQAAREPAAKTVTLALSPQEAQSVVLLEENGACGLRLALRASGDRATAVLSENVFNPAQTLSGQVRP